MDERVYCVIAVCFRNAKCDLYYSCATAALLDNSSVPGTQWGYAVGLRSGLAQWVCARVLCNGLAQWRCAVALCSGVAHWGCAIGLGRGCTCVYMCIYTRNKQMKVRHGRTQLHAERGIGSIMGGSGSLRHSNERSARALRLRTPCVRKLHAHRTYMSHVLNIHLYLNFLLACSNVCFPVPCLRSRVMVFVFSEFVVVCLCFPIFGLKSTLVCC